MRYPQGAAPNSKTGNWPSDFRLIAFAGHHHKIKFRSPTRPPSRFKFSIPLFHQPPNGEHDGETSQRHEQRTDDEKGRGGHYQSAEKGKQRLLPPAIDHVTTGDGAPDARRPKIMLIEPIMLIEQIHCCSICRNLIQLTSDWLAGTCGPCAHFGSLDVPSCPIPELEVGRRTSISLVHVVGVCHLAASANGNLA